MTLPKLLEIFMQFMTKYNKDSICPMVVYQILEGHINQDAEHVEAFSGHLKTAVNADHSCKDLTQTLKFSGF